MDPQVSRSSFLKVVAGTSAAAGLLGMGGESVTAATRTLSTPSAPARAGGSLTVGTVGDSLNFDPFILATVNYPWLENLYDQLMRLDNTGRAHPELVVARSFSDGGRTMTLTLRQGVRYHNGKTLTAADVVSNFQRAHNVQTGGNIYPNMASVLSVQAMGDHTVVVKFATPTPFTDDILGLLSAIDPTGYTTIKSKPAGTGPFKLVEWVPNDHMTLAKNADYWDHGKPYLDSVTFKIYGDPDAMISALRGGLLDIALDVPARAVPQLKSQFTISTGQEGAEFYYLGLGPTKPPFDKRAVRQAMAYALDRETIAKRVLYGLTPAIQTPFPPFSPAYFPEYNHRYDFNLDKARQLLIQAGVGNGFEFTIPTVAGFPEITLMAEILQADLAKINVKVKIQPMDLATVYPMLYKGTYQAVISFAGGAQIYPTRIALTNTFAPSANPVWPGGLPPAAYRQGFIKADSTLDPVAQKAALKQMVDSFVTEAWNIPIGYHVTLVALKPNVRGYGWDVYNQPRLANVSLA